MNINQAMAKDLTDSVGASRLLSRRFNRSFSVDSLHQLVKQNKLRAFMFHEGELIERTPDIHTRGKDLLFLYADLYALEPPRKPGRPSEGVSKDS
ncbi:hypothetical protein [Ktedonobacter racemifer]|uniref:Uncharacterized protein n=1 Tax=Ktedonobacter racemifer DSM 44963 TaxID=485913 RepID=D6TH20_KTERA|nr:hypothetical protein [Ktedonobacter racemifer]EFH88949.1 hypothetical protein Krac_10468 [Ktedonobacter racemifer DSM 44963]